MTANQERPRREADKLEKAADTQRAAFERHLQTATTIVKSWPAWKQEILGGKAGQPTTKPKK